MPSHLEQSLLGFFLACWLVWLLHLAGWLPLSGLLPLGLYQLYGAAAACGWLAGNVYVHRSEGAPRTVRRRLLVLYLCGPPTLVDLLRALAPRGVQLAAPLVPLYAFGVFVVLFLVPVSLRPTRRREGHGG